jgi:hypothetical protein
MQHMERTHDLGIGGISSPVARVVDVERLNMG